MEMDDRKIKSFLLEQGGDWIRWHKNPPLASRMGGVWKRKICSLLSKSYSGITFESTWRVPG